MRWFDLNLKILISLRAPCGVMVIVIGNRHGDPSTNPRWGCLHFT